ncbi:hypothetical protein C8R44DRAFT_846816 [Mycena epipterygia]|nr:hypothetical protein C8R44DRAFT_846816 [Mycena epipterygia]
MSILRTLRKGSTQIFILPSTNAGIATISFTPTYQLTLLEIGTVKISDGRTVHLGRSTGDECGFPALMTRRKRCTSMASSSGANTAQAAQHFRDIYGGCSAGIPGYWMTFKWARPVGTIGRAGTIAGEDTRESEDHPSQMPPNFAVKADAFYPMEYTDVHRAETVATEVVTNFAAVGTPAEEDWMGAWRVKSFQAVREELARMHPGRTFVRPFGEVLWGWKGEAWTRLTPMSRQRLQKKPRS